MSNTREYITLTNLGPELRLGFVNNMTTLADSFHNNGLIDDLCYERVTSHQYPLTNSERAREMWQSIRNQVRISAAYYDRIRNVLSASVMHAALVELMDTEYQRQGNASRHTHGDQPPAVQGLGVWTKKVDMAMLNIIKYYDTNNQEVVLRLLDIMAPNWEDIGEMIGFPATEIAAVRQPGAGRTSRQNIHEIIARWMRNAPGMPKYRRYPNTWQGILNILKDSSNTDVAEQLKAAVSATYSDFHNTFEDGPGEGVGQQQLPAVHQQDQPAAAPVPARVAGQQQVPAQQDQLAAAKGMVGQQQVLAQQPQVPAAQEPAGVVNQQQAPAQQPQLAVPQDFSKNFDSHTLSQWARSKNLLPEKDYEIIAAQEINGRAFAMLNEDYLKEYGFSLTGRIAIRSILDEINEEKKATSAATDSNIFSKFKLFFGNKSSTSPSAAILPECYSEESFEAMDRGLHQPLLKLGIGDEITKPSIMEQVYVPPNKIADYYDMTAKKHGVCFIINNKVFKHENNNREGTERDEYNLIQTWRYMGYRVEVRRNVTAAMMINFFEEIEDMLENIKQEDPDLAHDSFVCCILSHGEKHSIYGCDEELVEDTEIKKALGKSKTLSDRPKLLFFQTCQGGEAGAEVVESDTEPNWIQYQSDAIHNIHADFYISHATAYGHAAHRNKFSGSIYIQRLCEILCENSKQGTIDDLQTALNKKVPQKVYISNGIEYRQQCGADNYLQAKVHFFLELPKK